MQSILSSRLLSTRGGTVVLGAIAALLAAVILLVYLNRYRESVSDSSAPQTVLVAKSLIPKGTSGVLVGQKELFQAASLTGEQVKEGAIVDPATLKGRVAVEDIYPGQQLTTADFSAVGVDSVATRITGNQRSISVAVDGAHGNIGQVQTGDRVDIWVGLRVENRASSGNYPVLSLVAPNIFVLAAPGAAAESGVGSTGSSSDNVVLRLSNDQAAKVAWARDNGEIWFMLRPRASATPTKPKLVDVETMLLGVQPIRRKERAQ
jgi:Flp pilus assembly protein CpaB